MIATPLPPLHRIVNIIHSSRLFASGRDAQVVAGLLSDLAENLPALYAAYAAQHPTSPSNEPSEKDR